MALTTRQTFASAYRAAPVPRSFQHAPATGKPIAPDGAFPFTADAATELLTTTAHGLVADAPVRFVSTTTLPAGLSAGTTYYVIASGLTADVFKVSATVGGSAVNITSAGTGTHTWSRYLTADELAEVAIYLAYINSGSGPLPAPANLPAAVAIIALYNTYLQSPAYMTWWHDNQLSREAQFALRRADMFQANDTTVPPSADNTGTGGGPPDSPIPRGSL